MMRSKQRGVSLLGLIFVGGTLACVGVIGAQAIPTYFEFEAVKKGLNKAIQDSNTVSDVRSKFDKIAKVDNIVAITGNDIDVTKQDYKIVASFAYNKEVNITGPVFILIKYAGTAYKTGSAN